MTIDGMPDWMPVLKDRLEEIGEIDQMYMPNEFPGVLLPVSGIIRIVTSRAGETGYTTSHQHTWHDLEVTVFTSNAIMPTAYRTAEPLREKVRNKVMANYTLGGNVEYCFPRYPDPWAEGPDPFIYGSTAMLGIKFFLEVKEKQGNFALSG